MTGWRKADPVRIAAQSRVAGWFRMTTVSSGSLVNSKVGNEGVETSIEPEIADAGFESTFNDTIWVNLYIRINNTQQVDYLYANKSIKSMKTFTSCKSQSFIPKRHRLVFAAGLSDVLTNPGKITEMVDWISNGCCRYINKNVVSVSMNLRSSCSGINRECSVRCLILGFWQLGK